MEEGHLRCISLGEFLALTVSLEDKAEKTGNDKLKVVSECLGEANDKYLANNKSPSRKVNELDNRGSHFYRAQALAAQTKNAELADQFAGLAKVLADSEQEIVDELKAAQGSSVDIGGYYQPGKKVTASMRPSETFNEALASLGT